MHSAVKVILNNRLTHNCLFLQFLSLASSILNFITTSMLKSRNNFIRNYLSVSLTEQHMATLASIIKDVDKDVKGMPGKK